MARNIVVINGHPDPSGERLCAALAGAYVRGASAVGHQIRRIDVGALDFPLIRSSQDFERGELPPAIREAQEAIGWADHLVIIEQLGEDIARLKTRLEHCPDPRIAGLIAADIAELTSRRRRERA